ncbi:uncharacterized protein B0H64DRAFT_422345 [Chaetomium fimeti]|uniref:DUF6546 domain-containing protein n=1 Tax=Chaetomium fimeti TaxID=1854472 RepID=A0AAE0HL02_9PEZI|nr:hypothetical protein B0H64DRAFT_422345 [Chaetomium fimeti]
MPKRHGDDDLYREMLRGVKQMRICAVVSSWVSFPVEIRRMILEEVCQAKHRGWTSCAAVCKEWQFLIETRNFSQLKLQTGCLDEFSRIMLDRRRRKFVRYISLNMELPRYGCDSCNKVEGASSRVSNCHLIGKATYKLFSILGTWRPTDGGLTLDLSAYSPSDSEHFFRNYPCGPDYGDPIRHQQSAPTELWSDRKHGWVSGRRVRAPTAAATMRIFSPILPAIPKVTPMVPVVTGLVIRRQFRRQISPGGLRALWDKLPRLQSLVYEPWSFWRNWERLQQRGTRLDRRVYATFLLSYTLQDFPSHVRTLSIFEDFNQQFQSTLEANSAYRTFLTTDPAAYRQLVQVLASKSCNLERLYISFMVEAQDFFDACQQSYTWPCLQSLTLTSSLLTPDTPKEEIFTLLHNASLAALKMPQLETMALWLGRRGGASAVIYHREKGSRRATLTWRGTWGLKLDRHVIEAWKKVASDTCHLVVEMERVQPALINSHGDAIWHLRLPKGVIHPVSLWQICQEGTMQRFMAIV